MDLNEELVKLIFTDENITSVVYMDNYEIKTLTFDSEEKKMGEKKICDLGEGWMITSALDPPVMHEGSECLYKHLYLDNLGRIKYTLYEKNETQ